MVKLSRWVIIIFFSCLLLACASARMAEEVQSAKATFNSGNFKQAFIELLPLAVKCSAEAQYAVGYMYYYGLGVEAHKESGLFWIGQSAGQMYRPAIRALQLIEKEKAEIQKAPIKKSNKLHYSENNLTETLKDPEIQQKIAEIKKENVKEHAFSDELVRMAVKVTPENKEDEVLMSLRDLKPALVATLNPNKVEEKTQDISKPSIISRIPVKTQEVKDTKPDNKFTLQLFGSYKKEDVKQLQARLKLQDNTYIALTQHNGRDWYILVYGKYAGISSAKIAKAEMPQAAQRLNPWIRNISELRWLG